MRQYSTARYGLSAFVRVSTLLIIGCASMSAAASSAHGQSKFFSTSSRSGADGAKQSAQLTSMQNEFQRMNACTSQGLIYAPTHANADAGGCTSTAGRRLLADEVRITGASPLLRFSAEGAAANQRNYQIQNTNGVLHMAPASDGWAWQGGGYITMNRSLDMAVHNNVTVGGYAKVGTSSASCNASTEGALRYNATSKKFEFCNGTTWGW